MMKSQTDNKREDSFHTHNFGVQLQMPFFVFAYCMYVRLIKKLNELKFPYSNLHALLCMYYSIMCFDARQVGNENKEITQQGVNRYPYPF